MILQQLTLRNFCLFHGTQALDLSPAHRYGKSRPIVLIGGINGGGKTTIFDAIQLALYGSRGRCSKRASLTYNDFLLQCVHHGVPPSEGAGVALSFRYVTEGEEHDYEVRRNWQLQDTKVRETLLVIVFENRSGFHNKPKFCPLLGLLVGPNVISKPIGQPSDCDLPLDRYWIGERRRHLRRGNDA